MTQPLSQLPSSDHQRQESTLSVPPPLELKHGIEKGDVRALQWVVYPAMIAFIILAAYGFYLVHSLTADVHRLSNTIEKMQLSVDSNLVAISHSVVSMAGSVDSMMDSTHAMSQNMTTMTDTTTAMAQQMSWMNASTQNMATSMYNLQGDMGNLNSSFSSPFKMMSNFMPFFGGSGRRMPVQPPLVPYYGFSSGYVPAAVYPMNTNVSSLPSATAEK